MAVRTVSVLKNPHQLANREASTDMRRARDPKIEGVKMVPSWSFGCRLVWEHRLGVTFRDVHAEAVDD